MDSKKRARIVHQLLERDGNACHYCGRELQPAVAGFNEGGVSVDHVVPLAKGGTDDIDNLVLACRRCNVNKRTNNYADEVGEHEHRDPSPSGKYFHVMLNMADDDLDPYQYRLLGHYRRVCGETGQCWESTRTTAEKCKMSVGMVSKTRAGLVELGYITVEDRPDKTMLITVIDQMATNIARYAARSHSEQDMPTSDVIVHEVNQRVHDMNQRISKEEEKEEYKNNGAEKLAPVGVDETNPVKAELNPPTPPSSAPPPASPSDFQLMFGAVAEHIFGITSPEELKAMDEAEGASSRIGMIASWLARKNDRFSVNGSKKKIVLGFISAPAETKHLPMFVGWYKSENNGAALPRDIGKFVEYWREWASSRKPKKVASPPAESVVNRNRLPLTDAERAEMKRIRQQQASPAPMGA